jgi:hypothetical protein
MGPNLVNMVNGQISSIFFAKTPGQRARCEQGHFHDARSKHQARLQVISNEQPLVTFPVFPNNIVGSLFNLVQETQIEQFSICPVSFRMSSSFVILYIFPTLFKPFKDTRLFHSISTISLC